MTKKDYIRLAAAFAHTRPSFYYDAETTVELVDVWLLAVRAIADVLQHDNPRFDRYRFIQACWHMV